MTLLSTGTWSDNVIIDVDYDGVTDGDSFNLTITDLATGTVETFDDVTIDDTKSNFVESVVNGEDGGSKLISVEATPASGRPAATGLSGGDITLANIKNDKTYTIKLLLDAPSTTVEFPFIASGDALPGSIASVCRMFERQATAALARGHSRARACSAPRQAAAKACASPPSFRTLSTRRSISTTAQLMTQTAFLNLKAGNADANVSHYWPDSQRGADAFAQAAATRGSDGTALPNRSRADRRSGEIHRHLRAR